MNNKDLKLTVTEYVSSLSDEEARWLADRLKERMAGDLAEALKMMGRHKRMDSILSVANSSEVFFDLCDQITEVIHQACRKRGLIKGPRAA